MNPASEHGFDFEDGEELPDLEKEKSKMILDFGLEQKRPERVTIEVLQKFVKKNPDKMYLAARRWLHPGGSGP